MLRLSPLRTQLLTRAASRPLARYMASAGTGAASEWPSPDKPRERRQASVDVELPDPFKDRKKHRRGFVLFCIAMAGSMFGIIKYEDANSPVVSSTLYTLRRSTAAQQVLGQNITFASVMPWISGTIGAGVGVVNFSYRVKGDKAQGTVHFDARRDPKLHRFVVRDWSVTPDGGETVSLMNEEYHPMVPGPKEQPGRRLAKYNH